MVPATAAAAVAADDQVHLQALRLVHLRASPVSGRFATTNLWLSKRCFQSVRGAAATRRPVPAFTTGNGGGLTIVRSGSRHRRFSHQGFIPLPLARRLCSPRAVLPNPSLERTSTGKALGPRGAHCHHSPRGPSTVPVASAQLKR
jgi:hypothetical protein